MPILHAIVLGIVQGLSEFLPISSSGHLELTRWLLGWDELAADGDLEKAFDVAVHLGTLAAVLVYFRRDIARLIVGGIGAPLRRQPLDTDGRTAWLLVVSMIPAGITGVLLKDTLSTDRIWLIAVCLIVFGLALGWADRLAGSRKADEFGLRDALGMGVGQALALQPGVSRSGATMTVARALGFERDAAARLAFLMSVPVIAAAGAYQAIGVTIPADFRAAFAWGMVSSALTGYAAIWGTLHLVRTRGFAPFVVYRVVVGVAVLGILATSWR